MFERFTDRARRAVVLAQEEARLLDHNYIGTEHILLGLMAEGEGVAAKVLEAMKIDRDAVRRQVTELIGQGGSAPIGHIPFTPRAKKVLELSLREALQLGHNYIGTEHMLLGLIREGQGVAAQVLHRLGADLAQVMVLLPSAEAPRPSRTPAAQRAIGAADEVASDDPVGSHHLLLALLDDPSSLAAKVLEAFGVTPAAAAQRAAELGVAGTSDELPEEAGGARITVRVNPGRLVIAVDDPELADVFGLALQAHAERTDEGEIVVRGERAGGRVLGPLWAALRGVGPNLGGRPEPSPPPPAEAPSDEPDPGA